MSLSGAATRRIDPKDVHDSVWDSLEAEIEARNLQRRLRVSICTFCTSKASTLSTRVRHMLSRRAASLSYCSKGNVQRFESGSYRPMFILYASDTSFGGKEEVAAKRFFETNASVTVQSRDWPTAPAAFRPGTNREGMPFTIPPPALSAWAGLPALDNGIAFALLVEDGGGAAELPEPPRTEWAICFLSMATVGPAVGEEGGRTDMALGVLVLPPTFCSLPDNHMLRIAAYSSAPRPVDAIACVPDTKTGGSGPPVHINLARLIRLRIKVVAVIWRHSLWRSGRVFIDTLAGITRGISLEGSGGACKHD